MVLFPDFTRKTHKSGRVLGVFDIRLGSTYIELLAYRVSLYNRNGPVLEDDDGRRCEGLEA